MAKRQLLFGHVKFNMPDRHPSRFVNSQMDTQSLWFREEVWAGALTYEGCQPKDSIDSQETE